MIKIRIYLNIHLLFTENGCLPILGDVKESELAANLKATRQARGAYKPYPKMLNETRVILDDFYRPYNQDLADMLQDNRFLYLDS